MLLAEARGSERTFAMRGDCPPTAALYFSCVEIEENVVLSLVPMPFTAVMIAIEMPAEIRPYSIAVAADSSRRKALILARVGGTVAAAI